MVWANATAAYACDAERLTTADQGGMRWYYVKSGESIFKGSLVEIEYSGAALTGYVKAAADTANSIFAGVAAETVESASGTDLIAVYIRGDFWFTKTTPAITDVGVEFYTDAGTGPTTIDNSGNVKVGMCTDYGTSKIKISIDGYCK